MPDAAPTPAAERQRRHRERRRHGVFVARVLVTCEMVQALVNQGDVDDANSSDLDGVGKAITAAARRGLDLTYDKSCPADVAMKSRGFHRASRSVGGRSYDRMFSP